MRFQQIIEMSVGGATKTELLGALQQRGVGLNEYARILFADDAFATSAELREVRLAVISLPDIGLPEGGVFDDVVAHAASAGLEPCPLEIAPHLRLHLRDQPEGQYLTVASLKLRPDGSVPNGLYLRKLDGRLWLRGYESGPENIYPPDFTDFVFSYPEN